MKNNILNELRTPVFLVNKYNVITYINEIGEEFFGVSSSILVGKKINDFIPNDSPILNLIERVRNSKTGITEESLDFSNLKFQNINTEIFDYNKIYVKVLIKSIFLFFTKRKKKKIKRYLLRIVFFKS